MSAWQIVACVVLGAAVLAGIAYLVAAGGEQIERCERNARIRRGGR